MPYVKSKTSARGVMQISLFRKHIEKQIYRGKRQQIKPSEELLKGVKRLSANGKSVSRMTVASGRRRDLYGVCLALALRCNLMGEKDFPAGDAGFE